MQNIGWLDIDLERRGKLIQDLERYEDVSHRAAFGKTLGEFLCSLTTDERKAVHDAEAASAKAAGHEPTYIGSGMSDEFQCACGWKSNGYWDGDDLAWEEWRWHMLKEGVAVDYPSYPQYEPLRRLCEMKRAATDK